MGVWYLIEDTVSGTVCDIFLSSCIGAHEPSR